MTKRVTRKRGFKTIGELMSKVNGEWRGAAVAIVSGFAEPAPVTRLSFHENEDGGLVVMFHDRPAKNAARQPEE